MDSSQVKFELLLQEHLQQQLDVQKRLSSRRTSSAHPQEQSIPDGATPASS
jgi:hypothetical protein